MSNGSDSKANDDLLARLNALKKSAVTFEQTKYLYPDY
jgi:hypothetical protein